MAASGRHRAARRLLTRAERVLTHRGDRGGAARCALQQGWLALDRGCVDQATVHFERARDLNVSGSSCVLATLGVGVAWTDDARLVDAEAALRTAAVAARNLEDDLPALAAAALARCLFWQGRYEEASAVLVAARKLITTCHVTRSARSIEVIRDGRVWPARPSFTDIEHDLCVLSVPDLAGAIPADFAPAERPKLGDPVFAVGYPRGGEITISSGQIKGLYNFDKGQLVQVSAPFDHG